MSIATEAPRNDSVPRLLLVGLVAAVLLLSTAITLYGFAKQEWFFVAAGIIATPLGLAMLRWPDAATLGAVAILYTNAADVAVTFYHVPYAVGAGFLMLLVVPLIKYLVIDRKPLVLHPVLPLMAAFLIVQVLGVVFARDRSEATHFFILFVCEGMILYLLISNVVRTPQMLRAVTWVLLACGAFMGGLSCVQQATRSFDSNYGGFAQVEGRGFGVEGASTAPRQFRLAGPVGEKNRYAQIMLMLVPLGVFQVLGEKRAYLRVLAAGATFLTVAGMTLAFSRGAALGAGIVLLLMVLLRYVTVRQVGALALGAVFVLALFPQYLTRLASLETLGSLTSSQVEVGSKMPDGALSSRTTAMLCAGQAFLDHPVIGVGPGMFPIHYQDYARWVGNDYEELFRDAHNLYLGLAAEHGILGLGCFLLILLVTLRDLHRSRELWLRRRPHLAYLVTAYMVAILTYMATGIGLHMAFFRFFWFMLAMAGAANYIARAEWQKEAEGSGAAEWAPARSAPEWSAGEGRNDWNPGRLQLGGTA